MPGVRVDITPPTLQGMPGNFSVQATSTSGAVVNYALPTATDAVDPNPTVSCAPASGTTFALGINTVTCTATDDSRTSSTVSFDVFVFYCTGGTLELRGSPAGDTIGISPNGTGTVNWSVNGFVGTCASTTVTASGFAGDDSFTVNLAGAGNAAITIDGGAAT